MQTDEKARWERAVSSLYYEEFWHATMNLLSHRHAGVSTTYVLPFFSYVEVIIMIQSSLDQKYTYSSKTSLTKNTVQVLLSFEFLE